MAKIKGQGGGGAPWPVTRRAQAHYLGYQSLIRLFLHALGNEVKLFCSPSATETVDGEWEMVAQFGRCLVIVKAVFGVALAPGTASTATVMIGGPPPSKNMVREGAIHRVISTSLVGNGG
jgi:hypothetical protein